MTDAKGLAQRSLVLLGCQSAMAMFFKNSARKGASSWENMVKTRSQGCLDDGTMLTKSCSLKVFGRTWKNASKMDF